jgi:hypothetical protein
MTQEIIEEELKKLQSNKVNKRELAGFVLDNK